VYLTITAFRMLGYLLYATVTAAMYIMFGAFWILGWLVSALISTTRITYSHMRR